MPVLLLFGGNMTDPVNGLSEKEAASREAQGLINESVGTQSKTVGQIVKDNCLTFFNFIFIFFAILLITAGSIVNITFIPVVIINAIIGIVQELRAKQVLDKLTMLNAPKTRVIRDGKEYEIATDKLVQGDVCVFGAGNQIGADAKLIHGEVKVNESLVTGESDEIRKVAGDDLLSGSFVVSGECRAELTHVGLNSYISKLTLEAKGQGEKKQTEMMKSLTKLLKIIGIVMIPIGIIMFIQDFHFLKLGYSASIVAVVAALVGMIPEGLYLMTSIRLAVSTAALGMKQVLVHEMASVETLARVDTLCLDKTGTLTENIMSFEALIPLDGYEDDPTQEAPLSELLEDFVSVMTNDNMTIDTLKKSFGHGSKKEALAIYPFSSKVKYSGVTFEDGTYVIGAPEKLLLERYDEYAEKIEVYLNTGNRVLLFGMLAGSDEDVREGRPLSEPVIPFGLVLLTNPVRKTAKRTMRYFQTEGVDVKVISGDNPATVAHVAQKAGIRGSDQVIDASELISDEDIKEAALKYSVFGRVRPDQKQKLVQAVQEEGRVVAMTGDGVNDVLALKTADCSIAMGQGSEVVENISEIVLLDSDFSKMPEVVAEGRQVVNNIQRTASLFLVKNIFSILTAIFVIILGNQFPLYPTQLSFYSLVTIGIPGFFLAMQPNKELIRGKFVSSVLKRALPAALTEFIMAQVAAGIGSGMGLPFDEKSTMAIIVMLVIGVIMVIHISHPFNAYRWFVLAITLVCVIGGAILLRPLYKISFLSPGAIVWTVFLSIGAVFVFAILLQLEQRLVYKVKKKKNSKIKKIFQKLENL